MFSWNFTRSFHFVYFPIGQNSFQIWCLSLPCSATFPNFHGEKENSRNNTTTFFVGVKRLFFTSSISFSGKYYNNRLSKTLDCGKEHAINLKVSNYIGFGALAYWIHQNLIQYIIVLNSSQVLSQMKYWLTKKKLRTKFLR